MNKDIIYVSGLPFGFAMPTKENNKMLCYIRNNPVKIKSKTYKPNILYAVIQYLNNYRSPTLSILSTRI